MVRQLDVRLFTIPLAIFGAASTLIGLLGAAFGSVGPAMQNPLGLAGVGLTLLVAAGVLHLARPPRAATEPVDLMPIPVDPRARHNRRLAGALGILVVALVAVAVVGPGLGLQGLLEGASTSDEVDAAALEGPQVLGNETFSGSLQGAMLPVAGGVGGTGTTTEIHPMRMPESTSAFTLALSWEPGQGGASELGLALEARIGDAWEQVDSAIGGPDLLLEVASLPPDALEYRARVTLLEGGASTPIEYALEVTATGPPAATDAAGPEHGHA